jgi:hypothetical protein
MPKLGTGLSKRLLVHIGRVATTTAYIEQEFVLWSSAIYSQKTRGVPKEFLRMSFQRLLNKWHSEAVHRLDGVTVRTFVTPLRRDLSKMWPVRNYIIHGKWRPIGRQRYEVTWWEQTDALRRYRLSFALHEIREIADTFDRVLIRLYRYFDRSAPSPLPRKSGRQRNLDRRRLHTKPALRRVNQ